MGHADKIWMLTTGLERVHGVVQLYVKRSDDGEILLLVAKVNDDILMAGSIEIMKEFTL